MPTPSGPDIESAIRKYLPGSIFVGHAQFEEFMPALGLGWSKAWKVWQDGITGGNNAIQGAGLGGWGGIGAGGGLSSRDKISIFVDWPYRVPRILEWEAAVNTVLTKEFNEWASTFVFTKAPYSGSSSASPISGGAANAVNVPLPIGTIGFGDPPLNLRSQVESILAGNGWDVKNSLYQTGKFFDSMQSAITEVFTKWINTQGIFTGDIFQGAAAAGGGSSSGVSKGTGLIL